jgi:hypothetical protein
MGLFSPEKAGKATRMVVGNADAQAVMAHYEKRR